MTYVRDFVDASESIVSDNRLYFFREMHANVMEIYNKLGNNAHLRTIYIDVAKVLFNYRQKEIDYGNYSFNQKEDQLFDNFYKMIGYTRSIKYGLGRREQTYSQIMAWWNYYPEGAYESIKQLVTDSSFGYWGDIKHFCYFVDENWHEYNLVENIEYYNHGDIEMAHPLIKYALELMAKQLQSDIIIVCSNSNYEQQISNASKWVPQEKSKSFGWIYKMLAVIYNKNIYGYILPYTHIEYTRKQFNDIFKKFRKNIVSRLNKFLDLPQIKQCSNCWHAIDFSKVTNQTCKHYRNSFLNITRNCTGTTTTRFKANSCRRWLDNDRIECRKKYINHIADITRLKNDTFTGCYMNNNPINKFTTDYELMNLIVSKSDIYLKEPFIYSMTANASIYNYKFRNKFIKQWNADTNHDGLKNIIPVLDLDTTYFKGGTNNALYPTMIIFALGVRIIENTTYKKGCYIYFTNHAVTVWYDASHCKNIFDVVEGLVLTYNRYNNSCISNETRTSGKYVSLDSIYLDILQTNIDTNNKNKQYNLLFLSTKSFTSSEINMKGQPQNKFFNTFENIMNPLRRQFAQKNTILPHMVYWNLDNSDYTTLFKKTMNASKIRDSVYPDFKTVENTDRGRIHENTIYNHLFVRQEISQVSYNIIKDYMSLKQKYELNSYINHFYSHGINGMQNFEIKTGFKIIMESEYYKKMDTRFI